MEREHSLGRSPTSFSTDIDQLTSKLVVGQRKALHSAGISQPEAVPIAKRGRPPTPVAVTPPHLVAPDVAVEQRGDFV